MAYLEVIEGLSQEPLVECTGELTMGRAPSNRLCIPDSRASRQHAFLTEENGTYFVTDNGSANGTFLNRSRINPSVPHPLKEGDEIVICGTRILFRLNKPDSGAKPSTASADQSMLSIVMTGEEKGRPAVNASLDASISMVDIREEEKASEQGLLEAVKRLQAMVKVAADLGAITDRDNLLQLIMNSIFDVFPQADRSFILLRDKATGEMVPTVGRSREQKVGQQDEFPISRTIINTVVTDKCSILSNDAQEDDRFSAQQSIVDLSIRAMMCVPFIYKEEILGVINVDTMSRMDTFDSDDLAMLTGIAAQAAIAIKNQELVKEVENETQTRAQLARYISPDVVEGVLDGTIPIELGAEKKRGTLFFCDIVGFTAMSEKLTAMEVVDKLNRYFCVTTEIVTSNKGTLHKFGGDMIMAFWNVLLPDKEAEYNATMSSLEMQSAVWSFDLDLIKEKQKPIYLGIGVNTGDFAGGNIGGDRIEYTIIGDNVNLGQRIESMAGRWQVLVSESTYEPVKERCLAVSLPPVMVKGKSQPIKIYSIRGLQRADDTMTLCIPVDVLDANEQKLGTGILTEADMADGTLCLSLSTATLLAPGTPCAFSFDTPEIKRSFRLAGVVRESSNEAHDGTAVYTKAHVCNVQASTDVLEFLTPGSLIESQRSWVEMKRK